MGCKYTNFFNEITYKRVLKELIRLKYIKNKNYKELNHWLKENYNKNVNRDIFYKWFKSDKIMRVFGKTKEEMIENLKMESI